MAEWTGDFSPELGDFKVVQRKPLHIRLYVNKGGLPKDPKLLSEDFFRAFQWGVWRTFLHTTADEVTVTVSSPVAVVAETKTMTGTVTRTRALQVAREQLGVQTLDELLTPRQSWAPAMNKCRYSSYGTPGLRDCTLMLAGKIS